MAETDFLGRLAAALRDSAAILNEQSRAWALVGGLAVSARTEPRFTRDVDLGVAVDGDRDAETLIRVFLPRGYSVLATVEQTEVGRLSTVRLLSPGATRERVVVDLLFASSGIEPELVAAAEPLDALPDLSVPVARLGHLLALKVLSQSENRPLDVADILALLRVADEAEVHRTREAVAQIVQRGYNRGKDLSAELEGFLAKK